MPAQRLHRKKYRASVLPCPFNCGLFCRSASGLTRHHRVCSLNPANQRASTPVQLPRTPQASSLPRLSPPETPLVGPRFHTPLAADHPNHSQPLTPTFGSPRRYQWTVNGRGARTRIHPLLNGMPFSCNMTSLSSDTFHARRTAL